MTNDVTALIQVLSDYHDTLVAQYQRVGEAHTELATRYHALSQVYDGRGAAQFKVEWQHVQSTFEAYVDGVPRVLSMLSAKIEQLRRLDQEL
jgi:uncharacterized protein YukE